LVICGITDEVAGELWGGFLSASFEVFVVNLAAFSFVDCIFFGKFTDFEEKANFRPTDAVVYEAVDLVNFDWVIFDLIDAPTFVTDEPEVGHRGDFFDAFEEGFDKEVEFIASVEVDGIFGVIFDEGFFVYFLLER